MKKFAALVLFLVLTPVTAYAKVSISEIAWMGTGTSTANDEWIELYNDAVDDVSLDGWTLGASDATPSITLTGSIAGKSFFLLERTDDDTVPAVTADQVYTGALGNDGEILVLKKSGGEEEDRVDASGGWPAGDNATKETMQWSGTAWITGTGTPRTLNVSLSSHGGGADQNDEVLDDSVNDDGNTSPPLSAHSNPAPATVAPREYGIVADAGRDRLGTPETPIVFHGRVIDKNGVRLSGASYRWTFGDGLSAQGDVVTHFYEYPGVYNVVLNARYSDIDAVGRSRVRVVPLEIGLHILNQEGSPAAVIENYSTYEVNFGDWELVSDGKTFSFPIDTIIDPKSSLTLSLESAGIPRGKKLALLNPRGGEVARLEEDASGKPIFNPASSAAAAAADRAAITSKLREVEQKLVAINTVLARMSVQESNHPRESVALEQTGVTAGRAENEEEKAEDIMSETALLVETVTIEQNEGMFMKIVSLPLRAVRYVGTLFRGNR